MRAPVETDSPYFPGASNPFKLLRGRPLPQESNPAWETAFPTVNPISAGTAALLRGRVRGLDPGPPATRPKWVREEVHLYSFCEKVMHDEFSLSN